jgi:hypothetical protein
MCGGTGQLRRMSGSVSVWECDARRSRAGATRHAQISLDFARARLSLRKGGLRGMTSYVLPHFGSMKELR